RPGVCAVVPGPGVLNAMTALSTAYACSSPVLCVAAHLPTWAIGAGRGLLHEVRAQEDLLRSVTKTVMAVRDADDLSGAVLDGLTAARSARPQPVAVSIPENLFKETVAAPETRAMNGRAPVTPDPDSIAQAARLLEQAERPVVLCGGGVDAADASQP